MKRRIKLIRCPHCKEQNEVSLDPSDVYGTDVCEWCHKAFSYKLVSSYRASKIIGGYNNGKKG